MYDNIGGKLKGLASVVCFLGIAFSVIVGFISITGGAFLYGLIYMALGALFSWTGTLSLYGIGEAAEQAEAGAQKAVELEKKIDKLTAQLEEAMKNGYMGAKPEAPAAPAASPAPVQEARQGGIRLEKPGESAPAFFEAEAKQITEACVQLKTAQEILDYVSGKPGIDAQLIQLLEKRVKLERVYGNEKKFAMNLIEGYFLHGGKLFPVSAQGDRITCPVCGKSVPATRYNCFGCRAIFLK